MAVVDDFFSLKMFHRRETIPTHDDDIVVFLEFFGIPRKFPFQTKMPKTILEYKCYTGW
jgi:hypothetical protein